MMSPPTVRMHPIHKAASGQDGRTLMYVELPAGDPLAEAARFRYKID